MFIALVDFTVSSAKGLEALAVLLAEAPAIRAMDGNLAFQPYLHPESAGEIRIFHEWRDAAGFEAYIASPEFRALSQVLRPLMSGPPVSRRMSAHLLETVN